MTLDHLGIALASPDHEALFRQLLHSAPYKSETVEREGVRTVFFGDGGVSGAAPKLELLEALQEDSPVARFVASRGPGIHHLAFEVDDIVAEMDRIRALGIRLLADAPKPGADGKQIVFLHPKDTAGVLVELVQSVRPPVVWQEVSGPFGPVAIQTSGSADAPPLVVLHGALGSTELETDRLIRVWERDFRVIGVDLPGHGRTPAAPADTPTWGDYARAVVASVDALGLERTALFGFSMGGGIALEVARQLGDRITRMAVHGVNVCWDADEVESMVGPMDPERMATDHPFWARRLAEIHGDARWRSLVEQMIAFTRALPDHPISDDALRQISTPTLVSHGDRDRFFDVRHAVDLYRVLPDAQLWVLPGLDHPIQTADSSTLAGKLGTFLSAE